MANSIKVKRPVTIKTIVTDDFKKQAFDELDKEMHLIDSQIMQLELQNRQINDQASSYSSMYGEDASDQIQQAIKEISQRMDQMSELKQELNMQRDSIKHLSEGHEIVTGSLENFVELQEGENLYDKYKDAEIIIKDGIIQEIRA